MIIEGLIVSSSFALTIISVVWLIWFQDSQQFTFARLRKAYFAAMAGTFALTFLYTGDIGLVLTGIVLTIFTLGFTGLKIKERFKREPALLGFLNILLLVVHCAALDSYTEAYPGSPVALLMSLIAWLLAVTWLVIMVTGRKKLLPIYVFEEGMMAIFCLVPIIGIPLFIV